MSHRAPPGAGNPPPDNAVRWQRRHSRGPSSLLLPLIVVAVIGVSVAAAWATLHRNNPSATALAAPQVPVDAAAPVASATHPPSTKPVSTPPSPSTTPAASPTPTPDAASPNPSPTAAKPTPEPSTSSPASTKADRSVPVVVLNGTHDTGLAVAVRTRLRALGWDVVRIGNWRGQAVPHTTVFTNGNAAAVRTMWRDLGTGDRVRTPLPSMSSGTLIIVLAADYQR